ncbi:DNA modification methylase [Microbacterium neungamense]|uniref:DNA modification methylase n=1 Tax=Microbacterium neungamense TaxID=2810535 RepID=UPI00217ED00F|nr:DNA modification methylase [Microbacterium neungamense]UWF77064.1 DNA modification methylase [Microbacterium neungamense]
MKSRLAASVAPRLAATAVLGAAVAFGATGCAFLTHQATTIQYPASDGVNIETTGGPVEVRNAMVVADAEGEVGNLVAALVNTSNDDATLTVEVNGETLTVDVPGGERVSLGADEDPLEIEGLDAVPGSTVEIYFASGGDAGSAAEVPVLDGTLPYYRDLVPGGFTPAPEPTESESDHEESSH